MLSYIRVYRRLILLSLSRLRYSLKKIIVYLDDEKQFSISVLCLALLRNLHFLLFPFFIYFAFIWRVATHRSPAGIPQVHIKQVISIADEPLNAEHLI